MNKVKITTHSGNFHADDVFSVATLSLVYYGNIDVTRSREPEDFESADIVLDVGRIYDPEKKRFDHHQEGGAGKRDNGIPYASFGLIWKHFGRELCSKEEVWQMVEDRLVQPIDAGDTGYDIYTVTDEIYHVVTPDSLVKSYNPTWKEDHSHQTDHFLALVEWAKGVLGRYIQKAEDYTEAYDEVVKAYEEAEDKRLVVIDTPYPAAEVLFGFPEPLYFVSPMPEDGNWGVVAIRKSKKEFGNRKDLPKEWGGKSDEELQEISGVEDAVFCHLALFLAVTETKEGAIKMAKIALDNNN